jgi:phage terminase small subunit
MKSLTPKQKRFVDEYLVDLNSTQAAIRSKYSEKTAYSIGHEILKKPEVQQAIEAGQLQVEVRTGVTVDFVIQNLVTVVNRCMQAERVIGRDGEWTGDYRFNAAGATRALELLGRHLGMFLDRVKIDGPDPAVGSLPLSLQQMLDEEYGRLE